MDEVIDTGGACFFREVQVGQAEMEGTWPIKRDCITH